MANDPESCYPYFTTRIALTVESIISAKQSTAWGTFFDKWKHDELVRILLENTSTEIMAILNHVNPPSFDDLCSQSWEETKDLSVYGKLIFDPTIINPSTDRHWLYVGSATSRDGGLSKRKRGHLYPSPLHQDSFHMRLVFGPITRQQSFITLFRMKDADLDSDQGLMLARKICLFSEAVYASYLGAYSMMVDVNMKYTCVFGNLDKVFSWYGAFIFICWKGSGS
ncbi:hypothetical protein BDW59DRAFT_161169 [Aspergillus cavernicola]|uniref:Uncharacterized protein n=1 Tax=Aspergillus cavernicola TaxID=176166 RepID=A0ABR4IGL9_9EURO